jgi:hypothetical protein
MLKVGQKVRFDPLAYCDGMGAETYKGEIVTGTIVFINDKHRWFSVEYGGQMTSFNYADIGEEVTVIG